MKRLILLALLSLLTVCPTFAELPPSGGTAECAPPSTGVLLASGFAGSGEATDPATTAGRIVRSRKPILTLFHVGRHRLLFDNVLKNDSQPRPG